MHGSIFLSLTLFVEKSLGTQGWFDVLKAAGLDGRHYSPMRVYPDAELTALVGAAVRLCGVPAPELSRQFGEFLVPTLFRMYGAYLSRHWKTLDVIEHTEATIHTVVRADEPGAKPPRLECVRSSADEVVVTYRSPRRMCSLALGIIEGVAKSFHERVEIEEPKCMHRGDAECVIKVRRLD